MPAPISARFRAVLIGKTRGELRSDIQALRAIAVGSVLLYHLWPVRLTGGFVGVDVFFAISGFLITSHLMREVALTGKVHVGRFWARRAKRLLPASLLVLVLIAIATVLIVPQRLWRQFLSEVIASALYVENWMLAANSVDYLALENAPSPTQHFWTLSVEEQFYIALPLLLMIVLAFVGRRQAWRTRAVAVTLAVSVAASLIYSVWLTATTPSVAYFSTFTRAWEFGAGALLALVTMKAGRWATRVLPIVGVAAIGVACVAYGTGTPFPGVAAALPVAGALLVLWAGRGSVVGRVGEWWPVATLGHISYAVYLWHWPLIVLLPFVTGRPLSTLDKGAIIVATLALAWLSTRYVEEPVRFSSRLLGGRRRSYTVGAWSAAGMAVVVLVAGTGIVVQAQREQAKAEVIAAVRNTPPECFGAASMDPALAPCDNPDLAGSVIPDPALAARDDDNREECWEMDDSGQPNICTVADPADPTLRVVAVGDSHNNTLIGAYTQVAESQGWHMQVAGEPGCYLTTATQASISDEQWAECLEWRAAITEWLVSDPPDAVIVTHSAGDRLVIPEEGETREQATVDGLVEAWSALPDVPILAIRDNPGMTREIQECVSRETSRAAEECVLPRDVALAPFDGHEEAVAQVERARLIDLTSFYCTDDICPAVIGGVLVYRDMRHVTATWAHSLAPYLERELVAALER